MRVGLMLMLTAGLTRWITPGLVAAGAEVRNPLWSTKEKPAGEPDEVSGVD